MLCLQQDVGYWSLSSDETDADEELPSWDDALPQRWSKAAELLTHMNDKIDNGSDLTIVEYLYRLVDSACRHNSSDAKLKEELALWRLALPQSGLPVSLYLVKKVLGLRDVHKYCRHICPCGHHIYDYIPRKDYAKHKEDRCPCLNCPEHRFKKQTGGHWVPQMVRAVFSGVFCPTYYSA